MSEPTVSHESPALSQEIASRLSDVFGDRLRRDVSMGSLSTYRVGGNAAFGITVEDRHDLVALRECVGGELPILVVGKGSNLLVASRGFPGLVITLAPAMAKVQIDGSSVIAGGAAALPAVARQSVAAGLTGFEWAVGVPGSIGGAVRMNAGGHGSDMAAVLTRVRIFDVVGDEDGEVEAANLDLGYRHSSIASTTVVLDATLQLASLPQGLVSPESDQIVGDAALTEIVRWRRQHQPGGANAGSVFRNPPGDSAGRLIDSAGLRGMRIGSAEVSPKHANFIQADVGGNPDDIYAVMAAVIKRVEQHHGVVLRPETVLVGFDTLAGGSSSQ